FEDLDYMLEPGIPHNLAKWTGAQRSFRNQLVSVATGCKRCLRIIEMQTAEEIQTENRVPLSPASFEVTHQIVTRRVEVAGIGAVRHPLTDIGSNHLPECRQLFEVAAECGAAACGGLEQDHHGSRHGAQTTGISRGIPSEPCFPGIHVVAGVRHQIGDAEGFATPELANESGLRPGT